MDGGNHARHLQTVDLAALKLLIQQLGGFGHAQRQRFIVDIFHDNRHAFPGRLVGYTATHNACAQNCGLLRCLNILRQFFRFRFDVLIVEENTDQRTRLVGVRQRDKTLVFQVQRFFTTKAGGSFNRFHGGDRGWVMFPCRLRNHAFGDGKAHGRFNFAEFQRLQFWLAFGPPVEVAVDGLTQYRHCALEQFFLLHNAINQTDFQCLLGTDVFTRSNDFQRAVCTQHAWHTHGTAKARHDAQLGFR